MVMRDAFEVNSVREGKEGGFPVHGSEEGRAGNSVLKGRRCEGRGMLNAFSRASGAGVVEGT